MLLQDSALEWHESINEDYDEFMWAEFTIRLEDWDIGVTELAAAIVRAVMHPENWVLNVSGETIQKYAPYLVAEVSRQLLALKEEL